MTIFSDTPPLIIPGERIKSITAEGLTYLGEDGEEAFIDFALCHQNDIERNTTPEALKNKQEWNQMTDERLQEYVAGLHKSKEVGIRNFDGDTGLTRPFIHFYTEPPIRFEFATQDDFYKVQNAIRKAGWRTFDIT